MLADRMIQHNDELLTGAGLFLPETTSDSDIHERLQKLPGEYEEFLKIPTMTRISRSPAPFKAEFDPEIFEQAASGTILDGITMIKWSRPSKET